MRLHDIAVEPDGTIVAVGDVTRQSYPGAGLGPDRPAAIVMAYRPDGTIDRGFGHDGTLTITPPQGKAYTGFTEVKALPSGKLLVSGYLHQQIVLYRLRSDGRIDRVVTGGESAPYTRGQQEPGHEDFTSRRFLPNGRRDNSFGDGGVFPTDPPGSESLARAALTQPDGKVVAGGWIQIERGGGNGPGNTAMLLTRYR